MGLFFLAIIIEIIIQIIFTIKLKKELKENYWEDIKLNALTILITSIIAIYYYNKNAMGLSDAIGILFITAFSLISNLITFLIALIIKKRLKKIKKDKESHIPKTTILIFIANIFIIILLPLFTYKINTNNGNELVHNYLKNKYGDYNYETVNVYNQYTNSGMWDKYHSGYYYEIKCDAMDKTFFVTIDDSLEYIESDYFIPIYYSEEYNFNYSIEYDDFSDDLEYDFEEFNNYIITLINEKYNTDISDYKANIIYSNFVNSWNNIDGVTFEDSYYIINPNNKKIPTIEEIILGFYDHYIK